MSVFYRKLSVLPVLFLLICLGCSGVRGNGEEATEEREVDAFSALQVNGLMTVLVTAGTEAHQLAISGDSNLVGLVTAEVTSGTLIISTLESEKRLLPDLPLIITVTAPYLRRIWLTGATELTAHNLQGEIFALDCSGACEAELMGKVDRFDVMLSGAGEVKARQLEAVDSSVSISGTAELTLCVTDTLDVDLSGVGEVTYGCNPQTVTPNISGVGSVQPESP